MECNELWGGKNSNSNIQKHVGYHKCQFGNGNPMIETTRKHTMGKKENLRPISLSLSHTHTYCFSNFSSRLIGHNGYFCPLPTLSFWAICFSCNLQQSKSLHYKKLANYRQNLSTKKISLIIVDDLSIDYSIETWKYRFVGNSSAFHSLLFVENIILTTHVDSFCHFGPHSFFYFSSIEIKPRFLP